MGEASPLARENSRLRTLTLALAHKENLAYLEDILGCFCIGGPWGRKKNHLLQSLQSYLSIQRSVKKKGGKKNSRQRHIKKYFHGAGENSSQKILKAQ